MDHSDVCREIGLNEKRQQDRARTVLACWSSIREYQQLLAKVAALSPEEAAACRGLRPQLTDEAYGAEHLARVLLGETLAAVNELRDAGAWYSDVGAALQEVAASSAAQRRKRFEEAVERAKSRLDLDISHLMKVAEKAVESLDLKLERAEDGVRVSYSMEKDEAISRVIATTAQPGQSGRIAVDDFLAGSRGAAFESLGPVYVASDCHSRRTTVRERAVPIDLYAGVLNGLAAARAQGYQHARRVDELGPRGLRGNDPITAILIGIALVGAALVVVGIATGNGYVIAFGAILIAGSALVAFGGYTLVLAIVA